MEFRVFISLGRSVLQSFLTLEVHQSTFAECAMHQQRTKAECSDCGSKNVGRFFVADIGSQLKEKFKGVAIHLVVVCTYVFFMCLPVHVIYTCFSMKVGL